MALPWLLSLHGSGMAAEQYFPVGIPPNGLAAVELSQITSCGQGGKANKAHAFKIEQGDFWAVRCWPADHDVFVVECPVLQAGPMKARNRTARFFSQHRELP